VLSLSVYDYRRVVAKTLSLDLAAPIKALAH
jgi:hypothetical protein